MKKNGKESGKMKIKIITRYGEFQDIKFENAPLDLELEVEVVEEEE